ncbi:MAG: hypothetical protein Q9N67_01760 [Ghiorsea sp.]|nr:hypothetical protein [Ghiorsea sp.]
MAALKSVKTLPEDPKFRLAVVSALAGGNYGQAMAMTGREAGDVASAAASAHLSEDLQAVNENPNLVFQDFSAHAKESVEGQLASPATAVKEEWNTWDDALTCGAKNKDFALTASPSGKRFIIVDSPNDDLLMGTALLQRLLFKTMLKNSTFENESDAQKRAHLLARLACVGGKSRKITSFMGGLALKGKANKQKIFDMRETTRLWSKNIEGWALAKFQ